MKFRLVTPDFLPPEIKGKEEMIMRKRHALALIILRIEKWLESVDAADFMTSDMVVNKVDTMVQHFLHELGFDIKDTMGKDFLQGYKSVLQEYVNARVEVLHLINYLDKGMDVDRELEISNEQKELLRGRAVYLDVVGTEPLENVQGYLKAGSFIMRCFSVTDYVNFLKRFRFESPFKEESSAGCFMGKISIKKRKVNFILIGIESSSYFNDFSQVEIHEVEHFFNSLLFAQQEKIEVLSQDTLLPKEKREVAVQDVWDSLKVSKFRKSIFEIKDEILARLRENGFSINHITEPLRHELYEFLFRDIKKSPEEARALSACFQSIEEELRKYLDIFRTPEQRRVLIILLRNIPLGRFPRWLKLIGNFYKKNPGLWQDV